MADRLTERMNVEPPRSEDQRAMERFLAQTRRDDQTGCLLWTGAGWGSHSKRGQFWDGQQRVSAPRWILTVTTRPPEPGECACHTCDVSLCVEPTHLFWGSMKDNVRDMFAKGRAHQQQDPEIQRRTIAATLERLRLEPHRRAHGERNPKAKLALEDVQRIAQSDEPTSLLVQRHGVNPTTIQRIRAGKMWKLALERAS